MIVFLLWDFFILPFTLLIFLVFLWDVLHFVVLREVTVCGFVSLVISCLDETVHIAQTFHNFIN